MYEYVKDKEFLTRAYGECAGIVNQLVQELRNYDINARMNVVGSKKRNMVTQNAKEAIDFDFNLLIENLGNYYRERDLKEAIRKAFNEVLVRNDLDDCDDSTSALTTKKMSYKNRYLPNMEKASIIELYTIFSSFISTSPTFCGR